MTTSVHFDLESDSVQMMDQIKNHNIYPSQAVVNTLLNNPHMRSEPYIAILGAIYIALGKTSKLPVDMGAQLLSRISGLRQHIVDLTLIANERQP